MISVSSNSKDLRKKTVLHLQKKKKQGYCLEGLCEWVNTGPESNLDLGDIKEVKPM